MWLPSSKGRQFSGLKRLVITVLQLSLLVHLAECNSQYPYRRKPLPHHPLLQSRRLDTINAMISQIKQGSPKSNSISPSWNGKSPYRVIGVAGLPLQNEDGAASSRSPVSARRAQQSAQGTRIVERRPGKVSSQEAAAFRLKLSKMDLRKPRRQMPKRLPGGRRPPPPSLYDDISRPMRRPKPGYPTSRRGSLGPSPSVGRRLPQGTLYYEQMRHLKNNKPTESKVDFARRPPPPPSTKATTSLREDLRAMSDNARMEMEYNTRRPGSTTRSISNTQVSSSSSSSSRAPISAVTKPYQLVPTFEPPSDFGPPMGDFEGFSNPFTKEENDDFPMQSFEGPPRVKPSFKSAPTHPPSRRPHPPPRPTSSRPPPTSSRPPPASFRRPLSGSESPYGPPPPRNRPHSTYSPRGNDPPSRPEPSFKPFFKPSNEFLSPDGVFDEDDGPNFRLFGSDGSPLKSGPPVDFEQDPNKSMRPPGPLRGGGGGSRRPPPPGRNPYGGGGGPPRRKYTTERPIPTPGPEDFPSPPPRRPTAPPTHPTHPPAITHPPEHFLNHALQGSPDFSMDSFFDGQSDNDEQKDRDSSFKDNKEKQSLRRPAFGNGPYKDATRHSFKEDTSPIPFNSDNPFKDVRTPNANRPYREESRPSRRPLRNEDSRQPLRNSNRPLRNNDNRPFKNERPSVFRPESFGGDGHQRPSFNYGGETKERKQQFPSSPSSYFEDDVRSSGFEQRRDPTIQRDGPDSFRETTLRDDDDSSSFDEEGFFAIPESFPNLMSLGASFESKRIRNKRDAQVQQLDPMVAQERRFTPRRRRRGQQAHHHQQQEQDRGGYGERTRSPGGGGGERGTSRRKSEFGIQEGFWDDVETDFFSHTGPPFGQRQQPYTRGRGGTTNAGNGGGGGNGYGYRQQQLQRPFQGSERVQRRPQHDSSYKKAAQQTPYAQDEYKRKHSSSNGGSGAFVDERDNEILGSGNFEVIKGGTFYDPDTYYNTRYNSRPKQYYGENFLENFRDFADIKGDHAKRRYNQY
jgi:hypothetical protein